MRFEFKSGFMIKLRLITLFVILSSLTFSQQVQLQFGSSVSRLDWNYKASNFDLGYDQVMIGRSIMAGITYWDHNYFNLATSVGYLSKGGRVGSYESNTNLSRDLNDGSNSNIYSKLNYLTFNTLFELKYPIHSVTSVLSFGPRFDYLVNMKGEIESIDNKDVINEMIGGFIIGGGIRYAISNMVVGVRGDFYLNGNEVANWAANDNNMGGIIQDDTMTVNFTLAYNIGRDPQKKAWRSVCKKQFCER